MFPNLLMRLLPLNCVLCGMRSLRPHNICLPCENNLPILSHFCVRCAQYLPVCPSLQSTVRLCGQCLIDPPPFDHAFALLKYEAPVTRMIAVLKFQQKLQFARLFGDLFVAKIKTASLRQSVVLPDLIIPVPLHPLRLKERGFNQALEIARPISKYFKIPLDIAGLTRIKATVAQSTLDLPERKKNVQGAFAVSRDYKGASIVIIDDVMTTKQTLTACCSLLKQSGATRVDVWCVA